MQPIVNNSPLDYVAIIVAAGKGERAGGGTPKQFRTVRGKPVLRWSCETFASDPRCNAIWVVHPSGDAATARRHVEGLRDVQMVEGGATRQISVRNALDALRSTSPNYVLIHDAARPFLPLPVIDGLLRALQQAKGAVPVLAVADTVIQSQDSLMGDIIPREQLRRVQTPQAFDYHAILTAHQNWNGDDASDDAQILRKDGGQIALVDGSNALEKITFASDFERAAQRAGQMRNAIGMGYDVHRLVTGKELWLCGVRLDYDRGLAGHSDADVALHALTDAILGAIAEGDIGQHFPPSDMQWKGAGSDAFLGFAAERVAARGGTLQSVDVTIICEAPKIGPHRDTMRARIGEILHLPVASISVKATTTEGLGFTGRQEGIAAQAVASILLPQE